MELWEQKLHYTLRHQIIWLQFPFLWAGTYQIHEPKYDDDWVKWFLNVVIEDKNHNFLVILKEYLGFAKIDFKQCGVLTNYLWDLNMVDYNREIVGLYFVNGNQINLEF